MGQINNPMFTSLYRIFISSRKELFREVSSIAQFRIETTLIIQYPIILNLIIYIKYALQGMYRNIFHSFRYYVYFFERVFTRFCKVKSSPDNTSWFCSFLPKSNRFTESSYVKSATIFCNKKPSQ